jgi:integrase
MNTLKSEVKTYIQKNCPQGITLHRNDKSLYVKQSKMVNGKPTTLTKVINLGITRGMTDAEMKTAFEDTLVNALAVKRQFTEQLSNPNFTSFHKPKAVGTGTLGSVFDMMFVSEWGQASEKQQYLVKHFFNDLKEYFGYDKSLAYWTEEMISEFHTWLAKKIAERPKNMTGTVSNNSINKRNGVLRSIKKYALKKRLLTNDQLINPDPRIKNMGIKDLPRGETKRKPAFAEFEQEQMLALMLKCNDQFWYDNWAWAFDSGMRHEGELDSFTIDNVDFGRKTVTFWRSKTKGYSVEMHLTPRMLEIAKRQIKNAKARPDRKVFPTSATQRRNNWDKYIRMCNFNQNFTPYTTRHTFITRLAEKNVNPKVTMELAGHSCIETTLTYYTKSSSQVLYNAMLALTNGRDDSNNAEEDTLNSMSGHNSRRALK